MEVRAKMPPQARSTAGGPPCSIYERKPAALSYSLSGARRDLQDAVDLNVLDDVLKRKV